MHNVHPPPSQRCRDDKGSLSAPPIVTVSPYRMCVMGKAQHWKGGGWGPLFQQAYLNGLNHRIIIHNGQPFFTTWKFLSDLQNLKRMANYQKKKRFLTMSQNDQFPTSARPCLKGIVLTEVPPLITWSHFPFLIISFLLLSLLKSCLLALSSGWGKSRSTAVRTWNTMLVFINYCLHGK